MNLGQYIAKILLEQDKQTIAIFPGAFKPPHKGHFEVVKKLLQNADQVVILISPKTREGVTADESVAVWELYKTILDGNVEIRVANENPIRETYNLVKENPDTNFIVAFGKGEADRFKRMNYPNVKVFDAGTVDDVNATGLRNAIQNNNPDAIAQFIPDGINILDFTNAIGKKSIPAEDEGEEITLKELDERMYQNTNDAYEQIVKDEEDEIERAAQEFNVPIPDMQYSFIAGNMVVLSDDVWSKLENSDSWGIKSLEDAIALTKEYGKDWEPTLDAVKNNKAINPPLVLNYDKDKYYLVGGNTRLMFYKALNKIPKVLMATLNLGQPKQTKLMEVRLNESQTATIGEFIKYSAKNLGLQNLPSSLTLSYDNDQAKEMRSFGYFDPNSKKIWVYVKNRNMADILRTLAHELVHRKQEEDGRLDINSGKTGSDIENEANAQAGVLLRNFGKINNSIYEGLKKNLNELDYNINKGFDWKWVGGKTNKYTFNTGQTEYEVIFQPGIPGDYERKFAPIGVSGNKLDYNISTNEFKANEIYATVMNITLDFLEKNKDWKEILISPVDARRNKIVKAWFEKTLPKDKYTFIEDESAVFHIYRKIK